MATYYVSQQQNDGTHDGTLAHPFVTLAQLQAAMTGVGDICYIGPGTYRERYTFQANSQTMNADPLCLQITKDTPGRVRITGCGTDEKTTANNIIYGNLKTGITVQGYSVDYPLIVDGGYTSSSCGVQGQAADNTTTVCKYVASVCNYYGFQWVTATDCVSMMATYGFVGCNSTTCIAFANSYVCFGDSGGTVSTTSTNCLGNGGYIAFGTVGTPTGTRAVINCAAVGCENGIRGQADIITPINNFVAVGCFYGQYGQSLTYPLDSSTLYATCCPYLVRAGGYSTTAGNTGAELQFDAGQIIRALEPWLNTGIYGLGTATGAPAVDIFGRSLKNPPDVGPFNEGAAVRTATNIPQIGRGRLVNR